MLASITPLGQRGRHSRWAVTAGAFAVSATAAGAAVGAALGAAGSLALRSSVGDGRLLVLACLAVIALALDAAPFRLPGPRRQVDERWRETYRGWVYGAGYGAQLGVGVTTVVQSAATYLALAAALLSADPAVGALIVGLFGALRGIQPLAAARVRAPAQLVALHATLERLRPSVRLLSTVTLAVALALALIGAL